MRRLAATARRSLGGSRIHSVGFSVRMYENRLRGKDGPTLEVGGRKSPSYRQVGWAIKPL